MDWSLLLLVVMATLSARVFDLTDATISMNVFAYLGQSIELRCASNASSKFTRIQHILPNGTVETLLSNDYLNTKYLTSEIRIDKVQSVYIIRIDPVMAHSGGVYSCQDDVSHQNRTHHTQNMTINVIRSSKPVLAKRKYKLPGEMTKAPPKLKKTADSEESEDSSSAGLYGSKAAILISIMFAYFYCY